MSIFSYLTAQNRRTVYKASLVCVVVIFSILYQNLNSTLFENSAPEVEGRQINNSQNDTQNLLFLERITTVATPESVALVSSFLPTEAEMIVPKFEALDDIDNSDVSEDIDWFSGIDLSLLMKDSAINKHTLNISNIFQAKFNDSAEDLDEHFRQIEGDLISAQVDAFVVVEFINFYRDFVAFETTQANEPHHLWLEEPDSIDDAIGLNKDKQQYRREVFGQTVADEVWGHELKVYEYNLSAMKIVRDENYGEGMEIKDQILADLHEQTWGNEEIDVQENLKMQFYIKLASHGEALLSMSEIKRNEKIAEFRSEIFQSNSSGSDEQVTKELAVDS